MSDYLTRTRPSIDFTSPGGDQFSGKWTDNQVGNSKKLGIFDFPLIDGKTIQDLGVSGKTYPLTFWFDGPNHDLIADNFEIAFTQRGEWEVIHPIKGALFLQPASYTRRVNSVDGANVSVFETEWLEPFSFETVQSVPELSNNIKSAAIDTAVQAASQLTTAVKQDTAAERISVEQTANNGITSVINNLADIYNQVSDVAAEVGAIIDSINENIDQALIDIQSLSGQIDSLVRTPALASNDFNSRLSAYTSAIADFLNLLPETILPEDKSAAATGEAFLTSSISAIGDIVISSEFTTRAQIIQAIEDIDGLFLQIIAAPEAVQVNFEDLPIDDQYFSFLNTFGNLSLFLGQIFAYLLQVSLSLKIEKRFTITRYRTPWEIALTEYSGPGENDSNLDLFILSNNLKGKEIILLPPGKEVVVYV